MSSSTLAPKREEREDSSPASVSGTRSKARIATIVSMEGKYVTIWLLLDDIKRGMMVEHDSLSLCCRCSSALLDIVLLLL